MTQYTLDIRSSKIHYNMWHLHYSPTVATLSSLSYSLVEENLEDWEKFSTLGWDSLGRGLGRDGAINFDFLSTQKVPDGLFKSI